MCRSCGIYEVYVQIYVSVVSSWRWCFVNIHIYSQGLYLLSLVYLPQSDPTNFPTGWKSSSKNLKTKIQSFLHRSDRTSATGVSDTDLEITLIAKYGSCAVLWETSRHLQLTYFRDRMDTGKGSGGGQALYNGMLFCYWFWEESWLRLGIGDQCFGTCCRGSGYPRWGDMVLI